MFAGVCGGIADYLEVDPTLVRLAFVAMIFLSSGSGFVIYILLMLVVPQEPVSAAKRKNESPHSSRYADDIPVPPTEEDDPQSVESIRE